MKIKTIFLFIALVSSLGAFSQEAKTFVLIDSAYGKGFAYEIKKGAEITVKTDSLTYLGAINGITKNKIVVDSLKIPWSKVEYIKFNDKDELVIWLQAIGIVSLAPALLTAVVLSADAGGWEAMILFLTVPIFIILLLLALYGFIKYKIGRTIKYKDK